MSETAPSEVTNQTTTPEGPKVIADANRAGSLSLYEYELSFDPKFLEGKHILNFGSSYSNIGGDLKKRGIEANVANVDLNHLEGHRGTFVQADGRSLPFKDGSFDIALANLSTYQVPMNDKEQVYRELMRVGKIIHTGPVWGAEFKILQQLAEEQGFEIVASQPYARARDIVKERKPFSFTSEADYDRYTQEHDESERIILPKRENPRIFNVLGHTRLVPTRSGTVVVLKKRQPQPQQEAA